MIDTSQTIARSSIIKHAWGAIAMYQGSLDLFFPAPGSTVIQPGTLVSFYFDNWKVSLKWSAGGSTMPQWTRNALMGAGNALSSYFHHGAGEEENQHPFRATVRYSSQQSIWSLEVVPVAPTLYTNSARGLSLQGSRYLREPLPPGDCEFVFKEARQWAKSFTPGERIPDGTAMIFVSNQISLRLRVDRSAARTPVPIKYRDLMTMLELYAKYVTQPGQGWTAAWIGFGKPFKRTGYWELAQGEMTSFGIEPVNGTLQEASTIDVPIGTSK